MNCGMTRVKLIELRALVIIVVLSFLCVSDNVGPRLLPLPSGSASVSEATSGSPEDSLSHQPASSTANAYRVAIMAPANKRAGAEYSPLPVEAHAPNGSFILPDGAGSSEQFLFTSPRPTSAPAWRPAGRAPPILV
jgi:hypothetical protein